VTSEEKVFFKGLYFKLQNSAKKDLLKENNQSF